MKSGKKITLGMMKRVWAVLLAVIVLVTTTSIEDLSFGVNAANTNGKGKYTEKDDYNNEWTINITINGVDISDVDVIHPNDELKVSFSCELPDGPNDSNGNATVIPYDSIRFETDLSTISNVAFPDIANQPVKHGNKQVGTASIDSATSKVVIEINDTDFLKHETGRYILADLGGKVSEMVNLDDKESGNPISFTIKGSTFEFILDKGEDELSLGVNKSLGSFVINPDGSGVQTYEVTISGGWVNNPADAVSTLNSFQDFSGSALGTATDIKIISNTTTHNGSNLSAGSTFTSIEQLNSVLSGSKYGRGETIKIQYSMPVSATAVNAYMDTNNSSSALENKAVIDYTTNKNRTDSSTSTVNTLNASKFTVTKECDSSSDDSEQSWTITVNVGDYYDSNYNNLSYYLADTNPVVENPGTGLVGIGTLTPNDFYHMGNGVFVANYKTTLTDEYKNGESATVTNTVLVTPKGKQPISASATYRTEGNIGTPSIAKIVDSYDEDTRIITWSVTVTNLQPTSKNVIITDYFNYYYGNDEGKHNHIANEIMVDGNIVVSNGAIVNSAVVAEITKVMNERNLGIRLQDSYVAGKNGADIVVKFQTQIDSSITSLKNLTFYNDADLRYTTSLNENKEVKTPNPAIYQHPDTDPEPEVGALTKIGASDNPNYKINYQVTLAVDSISANLVSDSIPLVITDKIPAGLTVDTTSIVIKDYAVNGNTSVEIGKEFGFYNGTQYGLYYLANGTLLPRTENESGYSKNFDSTSNELTITIPVNDNFMLRKNAVYGFDEANHNWKYNIVVEYSATVSDLQAFLMAGETKEYTNSANYTYGGDPLNPSDAKTTNTLAPERLVSKNGDIRLKNYHGSNDVPVAEYTIDINPYGRDLVEDPGYLVAVDSLGTNSALSYELDTIKITDVSTNTVLTLGSDYTFTYDYAKNSITFNLPDSKHLRITYDASVNIYTGYNFGNDDFGTLNSSNATNTITIEGSQGSNGSSSDSVTLSDTSYSASAYSSTGNIILEKFWIDANGQMKLVENSQFEVYRMVLNGTKYVAGTKQGGPYTVDDTGTVKINNLSYNIVYGLYEIKAGTPINNSGQALSLNEEPYLFMLPGSANTTLPVGVRQFVPGSYLYYENKAGDAGTMSVMKTDETGAPVIGATLSLSVAGSSDAFATWTTGATAKTINVVSSGTPNQNQENGNITLKPGDYVLSETKVPNGYVKADPITFSVELDNGKAVVKVGGNAVTDAKLVMEDKLINNLSISKVDFDNTSNELKGAHFTLYDGSDLNGVYNNIPSNTPIEAQWTSNGSPHVILGSELSYEKIYVLVEDAAPLGYNKLTSTVVFKIDTDGKILKITGFTDGVAKYDASGNAITIMDKPLPTFEISKQVLNGNGGELSGATLQIFKYNDAPYSTNDYPDTSAVVSWVSSSSAKAISVDITVSENSVNDTNVVLAPGKYVLNELIAPNGYAKAEQIYFEITDDGKVYSYASSDGTRENLLFDLVNGSQTESKRITMYDAELQTLYVNKIALGLGNQVDGVTLTVYEADAIAGISKVDDIPSTTEYVARWTTGVNGETVHEVSSKFVPGVTYAIVETAVGSNSNYLQLTDIYKFYFEWSSSESKYELQWITDPNTPQAVLDKYNNSSVANEIILKDQYKPRTISVEKWWFDADNHSGKLANVTFKLYDNPNGTALASWTTSETTPQTINVAGAENFTSGITIIPNKTYVIKETGRQGYRVLEEAIAFHVDYDGKIVLEGNYSSAAVQLASQNTLLKIYNEVEPGENRIAISKQSIVGSQEIPGATLEIYKGSESGNTYSYSTAVKAHWVSSTTAHAVTVGSEDDLAAEKLVLDQIYALKETIAPNGYALNETVIFFKLVDNNGNLEIQILDGGDSQKNLDDSGLTLILLDEPYYEVNISKVDIDNTTQELPGATITVYKTADIVGCVSVNDIPDGTEWVDQWISGSTPHKIEKLLAGNYSLVETIAPEGYKQVTTIINFEIDEDGTVSLIESYNSNEISTDSEHPNLLILKNAFNEQTISISKKAINGTDELQDAVLTIYDGDRPVLSWTSVLAGAHEITISSVEDAANNTIKPGTYVLKEITAPNGYLVAEEITFTVSIDGIITLPSGSTGELSDGNTVLTMRDEAYQSVYVAKTGYEGRALSNANMAVYLYDDVKNFTSSDAITGVAAIDSWTSSASAPHRVDGLVPGTKYALVETVAPANYELSTKIYVFTVTNMGSIDYLGVVTGQNAYTPVGNGSKVTTASQTAGKTDKLVFANDLSVKNIYISKSTIADGPELPGARLALYQGTSTSGSPLAIWTSSNQGAMNVKVGSSVSVTKLGNGDAIAIQIKPGDYTLVETNAPNGYTYASDISFRVDESGKITLLGPNGEVTNGIKLTMVDEAISIEISKQILGTTIRIKNAHFKLYTYTNGQKGSLVRDWMSSENSSIVLTNADGLVVRNTYILEEVDAPAGYQPLNTPIIFKINDDGTITIVNPSNYSSVANEGKELVVYNDTQAPGILEITKTITGPITVAEAKGALQFKVTNNTDNSFKIYDLTNFTLVSSTSNQLVYKMTLPVVAGGYDIKEIVYDVDGKELTSRSYSVNGAAPVSIGTSTASDNDITGVQVASGNTTTVAYTNNYSALVGKLVITKTIEGPVTKQEAEGHLQFKIENTTTHQVIGTVGLSAFDYVNGRYEYTLNDIAIGTYQITEQVTDIDNRVLASATYKVNGGQDTNGLRSNVDVTAGGTSTVDYKNTYENAKGNLIITKTIEGPVTQAEVEGAITFRVKNNTTGEQKTYTIVDDFQLENGKYVLRLNNQIVGTYTVTEIVRSITGKVLAETTYQVSNSNNGTMTGKQSSCSLTKNETVTIAYKNVYEDRPNTPNTPDTPDTPDTPGSNNKTISISKQDIAGNEIPGATLYLYSGTSTGGTPVFSWVSGDSPRKIEVGENGYHNGENIIITPGTYTLKEVGAPAGYAYAEDISFKVDIDGKIQLVGSNGEIASDGTLIMRDEVIKTYISKIDLGAGEELEGATIALYRGSDYGTSSETVLESWVSTGNIHIIETSLQADANYVLVEEAAPEGYQRLETVIEFHVNRDGSIALVGSYSEDEVGVKKYAETDSNTNQILIKNEMITKTNTGTSSSDTSSTSVKTGDNNKLALWISLMVAGIGICLYSVFGYKRKNKKHK